jgi:type IV secretory pathway component VirB8
MMNIIKAIYCNQYAELLQKNKAYTAQKNGTILCAVIIIMSIIALIMLFVLFYPNFESNYSQFMQKIFGRHSGRFAGKILGIILFVVSYFVIKWTVGSDKSYNKTIAEYNQLSEFEKNQISSKGLKFILYTIGIFVLIIFVAAIKPFV